MCYLIAKEFDKQGCIAVKKRHGYRRNKIFFVALCAFENII